MKVFDTVHNEEMELDTQGLIKKMKEGRQVDFIFAESRTDDMGYLTWDEEHWCTVDSKRFIRTYSLKGKQLSESTGHNIYDLENDFTPEEAEKVTLS